MLVKCPKCGFENQLGAIFCRNCGEKLDIEQVRPKVVDRGEGFSVFGLIRKLLMLAIFLGLVGVIIAMFIPTSESLYPSITDSAGQEAARTKIKNLIARVDEEIGETKYVFSGPEATFAYNDSFMAKVEGDTGGAYAVEKVAFKADSRGFMHVLLVAKLGGKIPVTFEIKGFPVNPAEGETTPVSFTVTDCTMGKMPMSFAQKQILEKFMPALMGGKVGKILSSLKRVEMDDAQNIVITVK